MAFSSSSASSEREYTEPRRGSAGPGAASCSGASRTGRCPRAYSPGPGPSGPRSPPRGRRTRSWRGCPPSPVAVIARGGDDSLRIVAGTVSGGDAGQPPPPPGIGRHLDSVVPHLRHRDGAGDQSHLPQRLRRLAGAPPSGWMSAMARPTWSAGTSRRRSYQGSSRMLRAHLSPVAPPGRWPGGNRPPRCASHGPDRPPA